MTRKRLQTRAATVSVLFSEPKIPQFPQYTPEHPFCQGFSALQRAENSSILPASKDDALRLLGFSALQRAENSSIREVHPPLQPLAGVSVLFSEPKIPQFVKLVKRVTVPLLFQCSSASRKFLNW